VSAPQVDRETRQDVAELLVRYATGIDRRDWSLFRSCFTDDCEADYGDIGRWRDADALTSWMKQSHAACGHTLHRITNQAVERDGDAVAARSYVDAVVMGPDNATGVRAIGYYDDRLRQGDDGWRIARRTFTMVLLQPVGGHGPTTLEDVEAIKQLKARYFRTIDSKDWDALTDVFTDDVVIDTTASGGNVVTGAVPFVAFLREAIGDVVTVHHGHTAEIEVTSPSTATGVWAMEDQLRWPDGRELRGYGHYHETYEKTGGGWRIKTSTLTRVRMDLIDPAGG
jgi:3-phenylpropionate/cinnamic acid dioxygenase small subunit